MPEIDPITREEKLWSGEDIEPITREEMYIKHIYDKTQTIPSKPITRKEMLLEKAGEGGGSDVTIKQLSVTANGTYSEENTAYSPVIVNVPKTPLSKLTVTENGTYTAPTGTGYDEVVVDVPLPTNAYLLKEVEDLPKDIASFTDGSNLPMPSLKVGIDPIQDLHGYDYPWAGGAGKNKLPNIATSQTINGITFTVNSDGTVNVNGTSTATTTLVTLVVARISNTNLVAGTEYILSGCPNAADENYRVVISDDITTTYSDWGSGVTFTLSNDFVTNNAKIRIVINANTTVSNKVFQPMIRLANVTDATFAPYSNICPISGHTEANVVVSPTTDAEDGTTYNIQFKDGDNPLTVYGGTLDVVSGELTVTDEYIASYNGETLPATWISDRDVYAEGTTPTTGAEVVYELATPQTYQLTPTQVNSLLGANNVWADTGDIQELEYFSKEA